MIAQLSDNLLSRAGGYITEAFGLYFPPARWRDLQRGIELAAADLGFNSPLDCAAWIANGKPSPEQLNLLATHFTISETYFFRDAALFQHLEHTLLPALIERRRTEDMRLRLWCAGCCTGEEAYSLAILLHRLIPDLPRWKVSLLATDVNVDSLAAARTGCYGPWSFRNSSAWNDARYFEPGPGKCFTVRPALRALVHFKQLNLARSDYPSMLNDTTDVDVLVCRNVLMYFEPEAARGAIARLADAVTEGGWLIVAPSELSLVEHVRLAPLHLESTILHRKSTAPPPAPAHAPPSVELPVTRPFVSAPASAARTLDRSPVVTASPGVEDTLEQAEALFSAREHRAAWTIAASILEECPSDRRAMRLLARICANEGRLAEARAWCERVIAADRVDPLGYYLRALVLHEQGFHAEASDALRQTLYLDPDFILAHFTLGALAHAIGDTDSSQRHWRNTVRILTRVEPEETVPESDGLSAARLLDIVGALIETEPAI